VSITADTLTASDEGFISTSSSGHGRGGSIQVTATGAISLSSNSSIIAAARSKGKGGDVAVTAANIALSGATISASAFSDGAAGSVSVIASGAIELSQGGTIQSAAVKVATRPRGSDGDAGQVYVKAASLDLTNGGIITSATNGKGSAGNIIIDVGAVSVSGAIDTIVLGQPKHTPSQITSSAKSATGGRAGTLIINANSLNISSGGLIETNSQNANAAGAITLNVPAISIDGAGSRVSSVNSGTSGGDAGAIAVHTDPITLSNGGAITTDSRTGAAGGIDLIFDHGGLLVLEGAVDQGVITTTSATATAGRITIAGPAAIILNGGRIRALGPFQGAQVDIGGGVLVESSDRPNSIDVAGALTLNTQIADIAEAVTASDLSFLDASKVLRGQCATQTASGETSRLTTRLSGPYEPSPRRVASRRSSLRRPLSPCPGAG
jgi:large exoprotein involved in heme utilization and adhesion